MRLYLVALGLDQIDWLVKGETYITLRNIFSGCRFLTNWLLWVLVFLQVLWIAVWIPF